MEGILRFEQATNSWFIYGERAFQVEPHSCPGTMPTDILTYDGMKVDFEVVTLAFGESEHDIKEGDFASIDWEWAENNLFSEEDEGSPYCPVCSGCGESGCCSPLNCEPDNPKCHYPKTYTEDLKLGYRTFSKWYDLLQQNDWFGKEEEFMKIYDEMLDIRFRANEE